MLLILYRNKTEKCTEVIFILVCLPHRYDNRTLNKRCFRIHRSYFRIRKLITTPGCSLSVGRYLSLLGKPAGSQPSRYSHRSLAPSVVINFCL
jgi:hypothetical protein